MKKIKYNGDECKMFIVHLNKVIHLKDNMIFDADEKTINYLNSAEDKNKRFTILED